MQYCNVKWYYYLDYIKYALLHHGHEYTMYIVIKQYLYIL